MKKTGELISTSMSVSRWRKAVAMATMALTFTGLTSACRGVTTSSGNYAISALPQEAPAPYAKVGDPSIPQRACPDTIFASAGVVIYDPLVSEIAGKPGLYPRNIQSKGPDANNVLQLDNGQPQDPGNHQWYDVKTHAKVPDNQIAAHCQSGTEVDIEAVKTTTLGEVPMYVDVAYAPGANTYDTAPPAVFDIKHIRHIPLPPGCVPGWVEPITVG
jgi:hypothetical protein